MKTQTSPFAGKTILITGASSGIGAELARCLAGSQAHLVLAARSRQRLENLAAELRATGRCSVSIRVIDLARPGAAEDLHRSLDADGLAVDLLVNNAGSGVSGPVLANSLAEIRQMIELNVTALTTLSRLFGADMARRGQGQILNVASTGAYQPGPYTAVYYAAKAYVRSFSLALANELADSGVTVTTLCPGATRTAFSQRAGKADVAGAMLPAAVARQACRALARRRRLVIPGLGNKLTILVSRLLPGHWLASIVRKIQEPLYQAYEHSANRHSSGGEDHGEF